MSKFMDSFREEMARRQQDRQRGQLLKFAEYKAKKMAEEGKSANEIAKTLAPHLGCPCCGPDWYRDIVIQSFQDEGLALPLELQGVNR